MLIRQHIEIFFVSWFFLLIVLFIVGLLLCIWVYRDAEKRGMNGALWLIIVLIANIVGLIIYLVVREPEVVRKMPPSTTQSGFTSRFCVNCGKSLSADAKFCSNCGKEQT